MTSFLNLKIKNNFVNRFLMIGYTGKAHEDESTGENYSIKSFGLNLGEIIVEQYSGNGSVVKHQCFGFDAQLRCELCVLFIIEH